MEWGFGIRLLRNIFQWTARALVLSFRSSARISRRAMPLPRWAIRSVFRSALKLNGRPPRFLDVISRLFFFLLKEESIYISELRKEVELGRAWNQVKWWSAGREATSGKRIANGSERRGVAKQRERKRPTKKRKKKEEIFFFFKQMTFSSSFGCPHFLNGFFSPKEEEEEGKAFFHQSRNR